jgi:hypothetical protein
MAPPSKEWLYEIRKRFGEYQPQLFLCSFYLNCFLHSFMLEVSQCLFYYKTHYFSSNLLSNLYLALFASVRTVRCSCSSYILVWYQVLGSFSNLEIVNTWIFWKKSIFYNYKTINSSMLSYSFQRSEKVFLIPSKTYI